MKEKTTEQLHTLVEEKRETLRSKRFSASGSRSRNVKETKGIKKDIARALTELTSRSKQTTV